jgi:hypothetical protein
VTEWREEERERGGWLGFALDQFAKREGRERREKRKIGVVWFKFEFEF